MLEGQIVAWLLRAESALAAQVPAAHLRWDDAEAPTDPQVIIRRGDSDVEYNTWGGIDLVRTQLAVECYAGQKLATVALAAAVLAEMAPLRGGEIYFVRFVRMPDRGFHRETARYRRDVEFLIVHKGEL